MQRVEIGTKVIYIIAAYYEALTIVHLLISGYGETSYLLYVILANFQTD